MTDENDKVTTAGDDRGDEVKSPLDTAGAEDDEVKGDKLNPDEGEESSEEKTERDIRIPKARFDEAQAKARQREQALLEEIERLKSGQRAAVTQKTIADMRAKIEELQDSYEDLILDGKKDEARKVRKQIDSLRDELIEYQTSIKSDIARQVAIDEVSYNAQLAILESKYPVINPDHEDFDEEKTNEVATLVNALVRSGFKRVDALNKAVKYVLGSPQEHKLSDAAKTMAEERARKAREKAAAANSKQPPSMSKVGLDSDKAGVGNALGIDVMRLTQEKFAKLDEETKSKLRGDEL